LLESLTPLRRELIPQIGVYQILFDQAGSGRPALLGEAFVLELLRFLIGQFFEQISDNSFVSH
jgi:hypothetical protein